MKAIFGSNWLYVLILVPMSIVAQEYNTEEAEVPEYKLPELLVNQSGKRISTIEAWEKDRRAEVLKLFEEEVYGKQALETIAVDASEKLIDSIAFEGKASLSEMTFTFKANGKSLKAVLLLILPNVNHPVPIFLGYNFNGNHTLLHNSSISLPKGWVMSGDQIGVINNEATAVSRGSKYARWPVLNILARGYGLATMHYGDIDPDYDDGFQNGIHALFSTSGNRNKSDWGSIASWSFGLSKIMDRLEKDPRINPDQVTVFGHSRLGKTALWAGAIDKRFALVISNNSGCGGAALSKRQFGETVAAINNRFPHWFCDNFKSYNNRELSMPFDQHQLLALIAPRPLYVASAKNDNWADPKGEFLSLKYASEVYSLYDEGNRISVDQPPQNTPLIQNSLGYHLRNGNHDVTPYDWEQFMNFADLQFK
ncbi:MAG: acetylxylan esterase [Flavobacteriaceae bacterium]